MVDLHRPVSRPASQQASSGDAFGWTIWKTTYYVALGPPTAVGTRGHGVDPSGTAALRGSQLPRAPRDTADRRHHDCLLGITRGGAHGHHCSGKARSSCRRHTLIPCGELSSARPCGRYGRHTVDRRRQSRYVSATLRLQEQGRPSADVRGRPVTWTGRSPVSVPVRGRPPARVHGRVHEGGTFQAWETCAVTVADLVQDVSAQVNGGSVPATGHRSDHMLTVATGTRMARRGPLIRSLLAIIRGRSPWSVLVRGLSS